MSVFYKFKSALTYDTIQFDDLHISLQDFKKLVIQQKQFGKNTNFDLQVTNAETNEVYSEENSLIPKNSSLIVVRVPIAGSQKKPWDSGDQLGSKIGVLSSDYLQENAGNIVFKSADLAALNASENDKIQTMMMQSTIDYDTSNYLKVKGGNQYGDPPPNYVCHKCHHPGHWIKDCPITVVPDIKKSSGIPQSFMTPVDGPSVPGALMTPTGTFAVPTIDLQAYKEGKKEKPFIPSEEVEEVSKPIIPEDLTCSLCQDLLSDAVMMPCCGNSFCDDCIRNILIETEENQCPDCKEKDISPETLIPNRFLRNAVNNFRNKTGYRGGGQRVKQPEPKSEPTKSPTIETDDVEIVATIPCEDVAKVENEPETEMGSAIAVLGSGPSHRSGRIAANCAQNKLPTIHMEHRPPLGRPKPSSEGGSDNQRNLVSNGIKPPSETVIDLEKPPAQVIPHVPPPSLPDRLTGPPPNLAAPPNTSQAPPGYSQIPPLGAPPYPGGVPPLMSNFPPPPGVNPMVMPPQHMGGQPNVRMYPYSGQNMYNPQMNDRGFRSAPNRGMRMHGDQYQDRRNIVEDPLEAFERHLRERERQDKMRRNRSRRSRSRSRSRGKTRSISRSRSRSRTPLKKRSSTKTPPSMRKDSPSIKREFRSPVGANRSRSKSRSRTRMRSRSRSPIPRSGSMSPNGVGGKKKRSVSMSPGATKKRSRSGTPKKALRMNRTRSRSRSRSRSKSIARSRKRRRTRSRSRSISSRRSFSRGRSYSRSISPRSRRYYSPSHNARRVKRSRSPSRHHNSRYRSSNTNYKDGSPLVPGSYYEPNDYRGYRRGGRNQRYQRGGNRYQNSNQNYDYGNKYDRYGNNAERYDDKRYTDNNSRPYFNSNDHSSSRNRANKDTYHQAPLDNSYAQYQQHQYSEVAPPGTTDAIPSLVYNAGVTYEDPNMYNARNDKYRSPEYPVVDNTYQMPPVKPLLDEDWMKSSNKDRDHHDHYRRKSREKYHHGDADRDRERRHDSRSRYESTSPARPTSRSDEKRRSHRRGGSTSEKDKRTERAAKEGAENDRERDRAEVKTETSPDKERSRKDDHKEKKDKSKRKKKKDSDADKKKKKKVKSKKEEEAKAPEEPKIEPQPEPVVTDEPNGEKTIEFETKENDLYDDFEDTKVDRKIIENYIQIDAVPEPNGVEKRNDTVLGSVPELSKWERDDENSSDETKALTGESSYNDEQKVTTEILKRAENALFQKATKIPSKCTAVNVETKPETKEDDLILPETSREARKSGNSLQITVPVSSKSEDEGKAAPFGRISAKDRLGAKVDEKHSTVRSLVEPKKPALKSIVDVKHSSKSDTHKSEKRDDSKSKKHDDKKHDDKKHDDKKHEDRKRKESRHGDSKHSKHRDSKDSKDKKRRKSSDDEAKKKEIKEKESPEKEVPPKEPIVDTKDNEVKNNDNSNDVKSLLDKKRPSLDEASFEPDYDLTSESEEEGERKSIEDDEDKKPKIVEPAKEIKPGIDKALIQKIIDHISSSESSSDSSTDSSVERKKRKKKKSKKRKKTKKRRAYSSDTDSEESSESDSDSDAKHKRKKKHKHKNKKTRTAKKKKKSKHKS